LLLVILIVRNQEKNMKIKAQIYTSSNITDVLPSGTWQYRLLLEDNCVRLVEAYSELGYCDAEDNLFCREQLIEMFFGSSSQFDYSIAESEECIGSYPITAVDCETEK